MVGGLVAMALSHTRNAELLAVLTPLLLGDSIPIPLRPRGRRGIQSSSAVLALFIAAATAAASLHGYTHENPAIAPAPALAAAKRAGLSRPALNDYDFGGYLIFEGVAPFVDGRVDLYGDTFMRAYAAALAAEGDALPRILDHYRITWTLLRPDEPAVAALDRDPAWERLYADASAVVHRRR